MMNIFCKKCDKTWEYQGKKVFTEKIKKLYICCPQCRTTITVKEPEGGKDNEQ